MNVSVVLYCVGWILKIEGAFMLLPVLVAFIYKEPSWFYLVSGAATVLVGVLLSIKKPAKTKMYARDGFMIVALSWLFVSAFGAVPFVLSKDIPNYIDALFETVSGFTTTGASILPEVESLMKCNLFWRSFTHWIGGMGVCVFMMAIVPMLGGTTMNIMKAESTGPSVGKLVPRAKDTAKILYLIYFGLTILEILFLLAGRMPLFDALTLTFGTVGTGGFGVRNDSMGSYTTYQINVVTVFMILSGINFAAYFMLLKKRFKEAFGLEEVRWYLIIILAAVGIIMFDTRGMFAGPGEALKHIFFQVGSIITTTGYSTVDFDLWPQLSKTVLIMLMFIGACAGSTGGGMKVSRIVIAVKTVRKELSMLIHPNEVRKVRMDGKPVEHETVRSVNAFICIYFVILFVSILIISMDEFDFTTNFTAVVATFNDIGPGLALVGPTQNYSIYSGLSKVVLMFDMLAGRLELFPMLMLIMPSNWKRSK